MPFWSKKEPPKDAEPPARAARSQAPASQLEYDMRSELERPELEYDMRSSEFSEFSMAVSRRTALRDHFALCCGQYDAVDVRSAPHR
jgi:hypothetical protein